ncbi:SGNH/GDSL hydrolase family protein [Paenibacillus sp. 1-18]|uniref:SGNH/GDSL hydrolase family protein n=1 Tax=Paenibacillus sp. 1-18 TaxID=1333846 RepID=UPI000472D73B|nr:SGNH/GDSL hydrolase family protein [Paenibacillus sp. 1-18]
MTTNQNKYQGNHAAFLGDSITFGYELKEGEKPYPHIVSDTLGFQSFENHGHHRQKPEHTQADHEA